MTKPISIASVIAAALIIYGVIANSVSILSFFGTTASQIGQMIASPFPWLVIICLVIIIILQLVYIFRLRSRLARDSHRIAISNRNIRTLLDTLYSEHKWDLVRYERDFDIIADSGDATVHKTYVLTAQQPMSTMNFYIEARELDDMDRIYEEVKRSCRGGNVKVGGYRRFGSTMEGVAILGTDVDFNPPIHNLEHTLSMAFTLKKYFERDHFEERVHMALPTGRSIVKFAFDKSVKFANEETIVFDPLALGEESLGNRHFSRPSEQELKWEIASPKFGAFYIVSFDIVR